MDRKELFSLITRYIVMIFLGLFNLALIYFIFTPLTVYPVYFILSKLNDSTILISLKPIPAILFKGYIAQIINACVAGSAYYLLLVLNLSTLMDLKKRIKSLSFVFISFLVINIIRIVTFALLVPKGYHYFDAAHELSWYFGSSIMLIIIWFSSVLIFKIREVPVYSDLKSIYQDIKR